MYEPMLPQGDAAALMPGASYSVPGLFLYADLVYQALDQVKAKFDYDIPVKYIYGSPQVRWNCGRPVLIDHGYTDADLETELRKAVDRGITPLCPSRLRNSPPKTWKILGGTTFCPFWTSWGAESSW